MNLTAIKAQKLISGFKIEETLLSLLRKNHLMLREKDIIVISGKILALSQGRVVNLNTIKLEKLVAKEADHVFRSKIMALTLKNAILIPQAGIDLSNAPPGYAILWPAAPWQVIRALLKNLKRRFSVRQLGIVISDSHCQPLRSGVTGLAIAWSGFEGVQDVRGQKDIYGKPLRVTKKAVADNLASAALILMGEAGEKIPFVLIRNAPVKFTNSMQSKKSFYVKPKDCIFKGIYNKKILNV